MTLRTLAESDLSGILEDATYGFGWAITVTDPGGTSVSMTGFSNDISQTIDPDTGQLVSGRLATAVLRISSLTAGGLGLPKNIAESDSNPWRVAFNDINGVAHTFKVRQADPDRALGIVSCILEGYAP